MYISNNFVIQLIIPANFKSSEERVADADEEEEDLGRRKHQEEVEQGDQREGVRTLRRQAPGFPKPPNSPPTPPGFHQPEKWGEPG